MVLDLEKSWEEILEVPHILHTNFLPLLLSYISIVHFFTINELILIHY